MLRDAYYSGVVLYLSCATAVRIDGNVVDVRGSTAC